MSSQETLAIDLISINKIKLSDKSVGPAKAWQFTVFQINQNSVSGHGLFAEQNFKKGEFLLEYRGTMHALKDAEELENTLTVSEQSFLYYFSHKGFVGW